MDKYEIDIYWSDEDECFVAVIPELDGCTSHGQTPEEALAQVKIAREMWLDAARAVGREIPAPSTHSGAAAR